MAHKLFIGPKVHNVITQVCTACPICALHNAQTHPPPLPKPIQRPGFSPGKNWQVNFTHTPIYKGYTCLLVCIDNFTERIEAFPTKLEWAIEVVKVLLEEIIPRIRLPRSIQSDNGLSFTFQNTQGVAKALRIKYHLTTWRPQSSKKVERANQTHKQTLPKLCRKIHHKRIHFLPVAFMRLQAAPKSKLNLNPFEILYGRLFLASDLLTDTKTSQLLQHVTHLETFQQALQEYKNKILLLPRSNNNCQPKVCPGDQVLIKT